MNYKNGIYIYKMAYFQISFDNLEFISRVYAYQSEYPENFKLSKELLELNQERIHKGNVSVPDFIDIIDDEALLDLLLSDEIDYIELYAE